MYGGGKIRDGTGKSKDMGQSLVVYVVDMNAIFYSRRVRAWVDFTQFLAAEFALVDGLCDASAEAAGLACTDLFANTAIMTMAHRNGRHIGKVSAIAGGTAESCRRRHIRAPPSADSFVPRTKLTVRASFPTQPMPATPLHQTNPPTVSLAALFTFSSLISVA